MRTLSPQLEVRATRSPNFPIESVFSRLLPRSFFLSPSRLRRRRVFPDTRGPDSRAGNGDLAFAPRVSLVVE